jgi:enoyl-[acyl-carrier protein] reductase I
MLTKKAIPLMEKAGGGSILTMTYYGSEKVMPNYNVMGVAKAALESSVRYLASDLGEKNIRVNAISSGCIKTLASSGIDGISYMLKYSEANAPLKRNVTPEDNGNTAVFLLSDLSKNITGEVLHLDSGLNIMGMKDPMSADIEVNKDNIL